jgi:NAD(P)-dependent dehydrogenase (short-subunit alcohol dehydrogenase family)
MKERLKDKVAIVTGAGSIRPGIGNGKASAILYAREGAKVLLVDNRIEAAEETERVIDGEGGESLAFAADVSKYSDCKNMVEKCIEKYGRIDILHNNVGIAGSGGPVETAEEDWDRMMNVNLKTMFLTCKHTLPYMERQGSGVIVNISSIVAIRSASFPQLAYAATKSAVIGLTREIAMQYAPKGVRANAILPGIINTPFVLSLLMDANKEDKNRMEKIMRERDASLPMRKQGEAWDIAYAALFLASDESKYITGTTLLVDGGVCNTMKF